MINWKKYFDKIVCINFSGFKERKELMEFELKRVGILDSGIFEWHITFCGPYEERFCDMIKEFNYGNEVNINPTRISCMLGHLHTIKQAYYEGCQRILIIEDDERFLKDLDELQKKLDNMPSKDEYDLILLDKFIYNYNYYNALLRDKKNYINDDWVKYRATICSAGCYSVNRNAMQVLISLYDSNNFGITDLFFPFENLSYYWKRACAIKPLSVQVVFSNNATTCGDNSHVIDFQMVYKRQEISFDDYMMRKNGEPYNYGDYLEG